MAISNFTRVRVRYYSTRAAALAARTKAETEEVDRFHRVWQKGRHWCLGSYIRH